MMKLYILIATLFIASIITAQRADMMLLDDVEARVTYLQERLELADSESLKMVDILYKSAIARANIDVFAANPNAVFDDIITKRDQAIQSVIGERKFSVFKLFEELEREDLLTAYSELFSVRLSANQLSEALITYRFKYLLPRLSHIHRLFIRTLSIDKIIDLRTLLSLYYHYGQSVDLESPQFVESLDAKNRKKLMQLLELFKTKIVEMEPDIDNLRTKWSNDQDQIAYDLVKKENISEKQKQLLSKGQFALKQDLFFLHVLMIVPSDKELYLQNLNIIFDQQKKFNNLINK